MSVSTARQKRLSESERESSSKYSTSHRSTSVCLGLTEARSMPIAQRSSTWASASTAGETKQPDAVLFTQMTVNGFSGKESADFSRGALHEFAARLLGHDGKFRWFLFRLNPLKDERGQITRWYGTGIDIEERKQAEDRLPRENVALREEIDKASMSEEIVGTSPALKSVLSRISKVAPSDSTVLITGETGTGKELVAPAIHRRSDRVSRPFVGVNCAAIPRDLIT